MCRWSQPDRFHVGYRHGRQAQKARTEQHRSERQTGDDAAPHAGRPPGLFKGQPPSQAHAHQPIGQYAVKHGDPGILESTQGAGGTRIQIRSLPYGWVWFIPIGPTRASVGVVCPSGYYKQQGLTPAEMHARAMREQPVVRHLLRNATSGSTRAARTTGTRLATSATTVSSTATTLNVIMSDGATP